MVVFTCNHCGDSVQKPRVEKHYDMVCKRPKDLTCVDCLKDFRGEEFAVHTSCVTEDQRYSAKGTEAKPLKGLQKQENWVDIVQACYDTEPGCKNPKLQTVFKAILGQANIPRKKPKFLNYMASSMGNRINKNDAAEVFDLIQNYYVKTQELKKAENAKNDSENSNKPEEKDEDDVESSNNSENSDETEGNKSKKRKVSENQETEEVESKEVTVKTKKNKKNKQQKNAVTVENGNKRKNVSEIVAEHNKKPKLSDEENSPGELKKNKKGKNILVETATDNSAAESPNKKKNKKKNKGKNKQQNGVNKTDVPVVQNGTDSSKTKKKNKKNKQQNGGSPVLQNGSGSSNDGDKEKKNKQQNGGSPVLENGSGSSNEGDKIVVSKSKKRRQKHQEKAMKKANDTESIENDKVAEVTPKKGKKKNKKQKQITQEVKT